MSTKTEPGSFLTVLFSVLGFGLTSVTLNFILGDWSTFVDLLRTIQSKPPGFDSNSIVTLSRISDGLLVIALMTVQWFIRKKRSCGHQPASAASPAPVVFLIFLVILLTKHIAIVSYHFIRPEYWF